MGAKATEKLNRLKMLLLRSLANQKDDRVSTKSNDRPLVNPQEKVQSNGNLHHASSGF